MVCLLEIQFQFVFISIVTLYTFITNSLNISELLLKSPVSAWVVIGGYFVSVNLYLYVVLIRLYHQSLLDVGLLNKFIVFFFQLLNLNLLIFLFYVLHARGRQIRIYVYLAAFSFYWLRFQLNSFWVLFWCYRVFVFDNAVFSFSGDASYRPRVLFGVLGEVLEIYDKHLGLLRWDLHMNLSLCAASGLFILLVSILYRIA